MDINLNTKIYDLLKEYPFLEDELIKINPKFKKLKNPILRRTVARIASIKQAAMVGGMDEGELLNKIRKAVGLEEVKVEKSSKEDKIAPWVTNEPKVIIDANKLLDEEKNPLAEVNKAIKKLNKDDVILIKSDFMPAPLIDEFRAKGHEVYSSKLNDNEYFTYIKKS